MLSAKNAYQIAQSVNREHWVNQTLDKVSGIVKAAAQEGRREVTIDYRKLVIGAENLVEGAEMLVLLGQNLIESGYGHKIGTDGSLVISW